MKRENRPLIENLSRIFLFRHGETDWNAEERFQGHLDIPLNQNGRDQAKQLIPLLQSHQLEAILTSDLSRARETAQIVANALSIPLFENSGIREAHLGKAQGLTRHEIEMQFGRDLAARWRSNRATDADICYPGGETGSEVLQRAFQTIQNFLKRQHWKCVGVATHGGVIRRVMQKLLPPDSPMVPIPNTVVYEIQFCHKTEQFRLAMDGKDRTIKA